MKEVWICDPNYHKIQWTFALIFPKNYQCFEKLNQIFERVIHQNGIQTLWSWLKKTQLHLIFSTHFSVFGYLLKHSSLCLIYYFKKFHPNFHLLQIYYAFITLFWCIFPLIENLLPLFTKQKNFVQSESLSKSCFIMDPCVMHKQFIWRLVLAKKCLQGWNTQYKALLEFTWDTLLLKHLFLLIICDLCWLVLLQWL